MPQELSLAELYKKIEGLNANVEHKDDEHKQAIDWLNEHTDDKR